MSASTEDLFGSLDLLVMARPAPPAPPMPPLDPSAGESLDEGANPSRVASPQLERQVDAPGEHGATGAADVDAIMAWSEVHPPSPQPDLMQVHMVVPDSVACRRLAESTERLKEIAATAGCEVHVTSQGEDGGLRVVVLGRYSECAAAQELLHGLMYGSATPERHPALEVVMFVRAEAAGVVIGKQGFCLQQIRQQSGASINLLRGEIEGQRPCIVKGRLHSVLRAERHILDLVCAVPTAPCDATVVHGGAPSTRLLLSSELAHMVVGKQGFGLRQIRQRCGVKVQVLHRAQTPRWSNSSVLILRGPVSCRQAALAAVLELTGIPGQGQSSLQIILPASQAQGLVEGGHVTTEAEQRGKLGASPAPAGTEAKPGEHGASLAFDGEEALGERVLVVTGPHDRVLSAAVGVLHALETTGRQSSGQHEAMKGELPVT